MLTIVVIKHNIMIESIIDPDNIINGLLYKYDVEIIGNEIINNVLKKLIIS